jgi:hypothetical protein
VHPGGEATGEEEASSPEFGDNQEVTVPGRVPIPIERQRRIGLVGCVKQKAKLARLAKDLYISTLFEGRRSFVESSCDQWWILSAEHGLVHPDALVAPYDVALKGASRAVRRRWAANPTEGLVFGEQLRFYKRAGEQGS